MNTELLKWSELTVERRREILARPAVRGNPDLAVKTAAIIAEVRRDGDAALLNLTERLDGVRLQNIRITPAEINVAVASLDDDAKTALRSAIANVSRYHSAQQVADLRVETTPGVFCERMVRPIRAVGLYVPAGSAPLPSTAIMLAVPAAIAGCEVRVLCTPPRKDGTADPAVIFAALECGITEIYKIGGAQAVAAMAFGTVTVPKVDKIFGPGNAWVTAAKTAVAADPDGAAMDMPAGPTEVLVVADDQAAPRAVALDLLSQAEHGPDSQVVLVTTCEKLAQAVTDEIRRALKYLPRAGILAEALTHRVNILVQDIAEAITVSNQYAPEHLIIQVRDARRWLEKVQSAGSVFLGPWTPESVGDYCSGTNHVLPTYGYARAYSGLSLLDFQKRISVQELTLDGLRALAPIVQTLARLEGLEAHSEAVQVRLRDSES